MLPTIDLPLLHLQVRSYAVVRTAYVLVALVLTLRLAERRGISATTMLGAFALGVPAGILGARALDALEYWERYRSAAELFGRDGSSIYGAFLAMFPVAWAYARWQGVSALTLMDIGAPAMALGEAMTRIGCFLNGCCYGVPWSGPIAVTFPPESFAYHDQQARGLLAATAAHSVPVHPVQLYSATVMMLVFVALLRGLDRPHRPGTVFCWFLVAYGTLRLAMGPLRAEMLRSATVLSLVFVSVGSLGLLALELRRARAA